MLLQYTLEVSQVLFSIANYLTCVMDFFQALSLLVDYYYYGRWTSSVLNLLIYNVLGGGESHLYGTEGSLYYMRNGFNNFNFCFILALLFVGILPVARKKYAPDLLIVISPIYIWLAFMSLQPHKEERLSVLSSYFPAVFFFLIYVRCYRYELPPFVIANLWHGFRYMSI